jgi:MerR family transcriptional regulator, light-induced transcriptional regulator
VAPGEQHRVGIAMVEELLRRDGCDVIAVAGCTGDDLLEAVGGDSFDAVALSASSDDCRAALPKFIKAIRRASRNPHLHVLVGGPAIGGDSGIARKSGADATALDAWQAVLHMRLLRRSVALQQARIIQEARPDRDLPQFEG